MSLSWDGWDPSAVGWEWLSAEVCEPEHSFCPPPARPGPHVPVVSAHNEETLPWEATPTSVSQPGVPQAEESPTGRLRRVFHALISHQGLSWPLPDLLGCPHPLTPKGLPGLKPGCPGGPPTGYSHIPEHDPPFTHCVSCWGCRPCLTHSEIIPVVLPAARKRK